MECRVVKGKQFPIFTLGTVQLGMDYGTVGSTQKPSREKAFSVLSTAMELGVYAWDTANNYGDSEQVIGAWRAQNKGAQPYVITKIGPFDHSGKDALRDDIRRQAYRCCETLGQDKLDMLMLHNYEDFAKDPDVVCSAFRQLKDEGVVESTAISAYSEHDYGVIARSDFDAVQIPLNVFDWEKLENGELEALEKAEKVVFTRSVYLQGLVFTDPQKLLPNMQFCKPWLEKYQLLCREFQISPAQLAMAFALSAPSVTSVVLGCQTPQQVQSNKDMLDSLPRLTPAHIDALRKAFLHIDRRVIDPRFW